MKGITPRQQQALDKIQAVRKQQADAWVNAHVLLVRHRIPTKVIRALIKKGALLARPSEGGGTEVAIPHEQTP